MLVFPQIDPVIVALGPLKVHWYGVMYLLGIGAGWWLGARRCRRPDAPLNREQLDDLAFYVAMGVILGGRVGYALFYQPERLLSDPLWLLRVWEGGMSFHGGLLGVMLGVWLVARKAGCSWWALIDFVAPLVPPGLLAGRLGNFINGELWGRPTDLPWGMVFPGDPSGLVRHPSQLYQAAMEGVLLFILLYWFSSKPRPRMAVSGLFLVAYGCFRFLAEFVREPDADIGYQLFGWVTRGQLLSLPMVLGGVVLLVLAYRKNAVKRGVL